MRRLTLVPLVLALVVTGCAAEPPSAAPPVEEASTSPSADEPTLPAIAEECQDNPIENPAALGEVFCHAYSTLEVLDVEYDVPAAEVEDYWPYDSPDDPVWLRVDLRVTSLILAPSLSTDQAAPLLIDAAGGAVTPAVIDPEAVPAYGSVEFSLVTVVGGEVADASTMLLCASFLISPDESQGCSRIAA